MSAVQEDAESSQESKIATLRLVFIKLTLECLPASGLQWIQPPVSATEDLHLPVHCAELTACT